MRLRPNPPRLITVAVALVLGIVGFIVAWPVDQALPLVKPLDTVLAQVGLRLDRNLADPFLFACPSLLVVGSLLRGI